MLAGIGLQTFNAPDTSLAPLPEWSERGRALLGDDGARWVGLNPGASFGPAKRWIPERYAALGELLARRAGARIAILGGAAERPLAQAIADGMRGEPRVLCGETSLGDLVGVLGRLSLLVTNDSGPMHLAAAQGVPLVAIFGPTDWRETAPVGERLRLVREPVFCAPCKLRECPIDHRCMREVTVERVAQAARELLD
jgi:heptosyltransferase-2